jgi:hypothetical protein
MPHPVTKLGLVESSDSGSFDSLVTAYDVHQHRVQALDRMFGSKHANQNLYSSLVSNEKALLAGDALR